MLGLKESGFDFTPSFRQVPPLRKIEYEQEKVPLGELNGQSIDHC
jgi:hypothetical protein